MRVINTINRDRMALANYIVIKITKVDLRRRRHIFKFYGLNTIKRIDCSSRTMRYRQ